jgi:cobalamin biosynthesis Mg chelatase CobN
VTMSSHRHPLAPRALLAAFVLVALALGLVALGAAGPASAATVCGKKVIDDWYDNGRVDGSYPLRCYDDAIDALPRDVRDYSSAKEDITRALQARMQNRPAPPATSDPSPNSPGATISGAETTGTETTGTETTDDGEGGTATGRPGDDGGGGPEAGPGDVDTAASDSVPVPLLILGGLALLLIAAGTLGYVTRRLQARRIPPPA